MSEEENENEYDIIIFVPENYFKDELYKQKNRGSEEK